MHADYTRKTQEVAELRKTYEAEITKARETDAAITTARGRLAVVADELAKFARVDWQRWAEQDPVECQKGMALMQSLQQRERALNDQIATKEKEASEKQREITAKRIEEGRKVLEREIPGWGPEKAKEIGDFGLTVGLTREEISSLADPRFVVILNLAMQAARAKTSQAKVVKAANAPAPAPALAKVTKPAAPKGDPLSDDQDINAWIKARNAQVTRRSGR